MLNVILCEPSPRATISIVGSTFHSLDNWCHFCDSVDC